MAEHLYHLTVPSALAIDCAYGECEHIDEQGEPSDYSACPTSSLEVCVECMVERGYGADPEFWEDGLVGWPHEPKEPKVQAVENPAILKPPPEYVRCEHGYDHHGGPHSCDDCGTGNECPHWAWVLEHEAAVARLTPAS